MATAFRNLAVAIVAAGLLAACGDRLRVPHRIHVPLSLPALRLVPEIEARMDADLLERAGGELPERWPDDLPPFALEAPFDAGLVVAHEDLDVVGRDLGRAAHGDAEIRVRAVDWRLDPRDLNVAIDDLMLWVGPSGSIRPGDAGARRVGHANALEGREGSVVFAPGGRRALIDALLTDSFVLMVEAWVPYDTLTHPERPSGSARVDLTVHVDVLK